MSTFKIVKPSGRRGLWRVEGYASGKLAGEWRCDSEAIARELLKRLRKGQNPGWVAHDLRNL